MCIILRISIFRAYSREDDTAEECPVTKWRKRPKIELKDGLKMDMPRLSTAFTQRSQSIIYNCQDVWLASKV